MGDGADVGALFDGAVVPEATPSPRTIRFATPPLGEGPSRAYDPAAVPDDPRVARVFDASAEVTNVLVGPSFVAVTVVHAERWEQLLPVLLRVVTDAFTNGDVAPAGEGAVPAVGVPSTGGPAGAAPRRGLEQAWSELAGARPDAGDDLDRIVAASRAAEPAHRQVAAILLAEADASVADLHWARLVDDPSRSVRRATVDTIGDAGRGELRPLLEHALDDPDAWIRWRALRGLAALGGTASRSAVGACTVDPDFRVRLEAARVLRDATD